MSKWTPELEMYCIELLKDRKTYDEIANIVGKTRNAIAVKNQKYWHIDKSSKFSIDEVKTILLQYGLILEDGQTYENNNTPLIAYTLEGYKIYATLLNIKNNHPPLIFSVSNPFTLWNIKNIWLPNNAPEYELISEEYISATDKMVWKLKNSDLPSFEMEWSRFQFGQRHPLTQYERMSETKRRSPLQVRKELEEIISSNDKYNGWTLLEGEEFKYNNSQTIMKFKNIDGYFTMRCLLQFQQGDNISLFNISYPDISINNINNWLKLNSIYQLKSNQIYTGTDKKYIFICPTHGEFEMSFDNLRNKHGCKQCAIENFFTGINSPRWNFNKTDEERIIERGYEQYRIWRKEVFERDNYTCQCCGDNNGGNLEAHHLDGYNWCIEKRTDIDNGITLCEDCHSSNNNSFHKIYGYGNNTKEQFDSWIKQRREI